MIVVAYKPMKFFKINETRKMHRGHSGETENFDLIRNKRLTQAESSRSKKGRHQTQDDFDEIVMPTNIWKLH